MHLPRWYAAHHGPRPGDRAWRCMVPCAWYHVHGAWCMVHDASFLVVKAPPRRFSEGFRGAGLVQKLLGGGSSSRDPNRV